MNRMCFMSVVDGDAVNISLTFEEWVMMPSQMH